MQLDGCTLLSEDSEGERDTSLVAELRDREILLLLHEEHYFLFALFSLQHISFAPPPCQDIYSLFCFRISHLPVTIPASAQHNAVSLRSHKRRRCPRCGLLHLRGVPPTGGRSRLERPSLTKADMQGPVEPHRVHDSLALPKPQEPPLY